MSLLEFVGLEYLLGDKDPLGFDDLTEHPFGLIFILIGINYLKLFIIFIYIMN